MVQGLLPKQFDRATQSVVYRVARAYGFQQFNLAGDGQEWVAATAGLAADQLGALLRDATCRRLAQPAGRGHGPGGGGGSTAPQQLSWQAMLRATAATWEAAIGDVHAEYFEEYELWTHQLCLPHPQEQQHKGRRPPQQLPVQQRVALQLLELALWMCVYTEAANLRHTPHLLFLIYHVMRGSVVFQQEFAAMVALPQGFQSGQPLLPSHWLHWLKWTADGAAPNVYRSAEDFPAAALAPPAGSGGDGAAVAAAAGACDLTELKRSLLQQMYEACPDGFKGPAAAAVAAAVAGADAAAGGPALAGAASERQRQQQAAEQQQQLRQQCSSRLEAAKQEVLHRLRHGPGGGAHAAWVEALLQEVTHPRWLRAQQTFLRLVVQPLFFFLAEQIDLAGQQAEEEAALRIAYCDVDEACCSPAAVYRLIKRLRRRCDPALTPKPAPDLWLALQQAILDAAFRPPEPPQQYHPALQRLRTLVGLRSSKHEQAPQDVLEDAKGRYPRDPKRLLVLNSLAEVLQQNEVPEEPEAAAADAEALTAGAPTGAAAATAFPAAAPPPAAALSGPGAAPVAASRGRALLGPGAAAVAKITFEVQPALAHEPAAMHEVYAVARGGADFWAAHLFRHKTYVEARSLAHPFVAFWRVYAFHAALLTAMAAVAYVWHDRDTRQGFPWLRLAAALSLTTVTDALMRAARAGGHLMLLSYRIPVRRKVAKKWMALRPFPPGSLPAALGRLAMLAWWLAWAAALGVLLVPVLLADTRVSLLAALERRQGAAGPGGALRRFLTFLWLLPPGLHVLLVWGSAVLCQRPGYTASLAQGLQARFGGGCFGGGCVRGGGLSGGFKSALAAAARAGAHAGCASDPAIDALFFPAANLGLDGRRSWSNAAMWVVVVALKVLFEYCLVIFPLVGMMQQIVRGGNELLSSSINVDTPASNSASDALTLVGLAVPVTILSFCDTGIFFSLVGGVVSAAAGFKRGVGTIKTWSGMVVRFRVLLLRYQEHCVARSAVALHLQSNDEFGLQELAVTGLAHGWNALVLDLRQRDLLSTRELACLTFEELQLTHKQKENLRMLPHVGRLGLTTVLPARCFMAGAVPDLASGVVGSAHHLWVGRMCWGWLLWVAWQAGLLSSRDVTTDMTAEQLQAVQKEARDNLEALTPLQLLHPPRQRAQLRRWQEMLAQTLGLLRLLSASAAGAPSNAGAAAAALLAAATRRPAPAGGGGGDGGKQPTGLLHGLPLEDKGRRDALRDLSHTMNRLLTLLEEEMLELAAEVRPNSPSVRCCGSSFGRREANVTPEELRRARAAVSALRARWGRFASAAAAEAAPRGAQRAAVQTSLRQQGEANRTVVLEHIARLGQASRGPAQVVRWLADVLSMSCGDAAPADDEAVRFILSFASSLYDPGLGAAPDLHIMPSLTTLVPHYDEDVLYALSEADALHDLAPRIPDPAALRPDGRAKMVYLLQPDGSSTATLAYLRSVYATPGAPHSQWANFVERVKGLAAAAGIKGVPQQVYEYHFLPRGPLHPLKGELLLWASWRGQLLARTVRGLATYRTALQALADYENPQLMPAEQQQQLAALEEAHHQRATRLAQLAQRAAHLRQSVAQEQQRLDGLRQQLLQQEPPLLPEQQRRLLSQKQALLQQLAQHAAELQRVEAEGGRAHAQLDAQQEQQLRELRDAAAYWGALRDALLQDLVGGKCGLVVSSQNLGVFASAEESAANMKAAWLAHSVDVLRGMHPALKVAFIDKRKLVSGSRPGHRVDLFRQASVLLASERHKQLAAAAGLHATAEAYRVLLPVNFESGRGVVIGEGKPENQNSALPFCHGEALQTIDCNQDSILAEGLKVRNLLAELLPDDVSAATHSHQKGSDPPGAAGDPLAGFFGKHAGSPAAAAVAAAAAAAPGSAGRKQRRPGPKGRVALVGFREWIFSEDSGALAEFAAATERSFGTTIQRLMYNPGGCRFHYGHPDVWRRSFVSTCGGVSKANKGLHVSEDVFGGYNVMLRGRDITYADFISVGKGRDMGMEQILTFEAKIAAGNGEQVLSREVRRLAHNMDFCRLLTWYHTGNGFFVNTALTMLSIHASLWAYLLLALSRSSSDAVQAYLSAIQVLQLGSLSIVVYLLTLALEGGILAAVFTVARQLLQGSLMFFICRAQTTAHAFTQDLLFGGAKYLPTGRGYKLAPTSLRDLYRRYGRSHLYYGAVLLQYALACAAAAHLHGARVLVLWAPFLVIVSLLFGPFFFTPFAFRTTVVTDDFASLQQWLMSPSPEPDKGWAAWNAQAWRAASNASGKQMGRLGACVRAHLAKLPTLVMVLAAVARMKTYAGNRLPKWATALVLAGGFLFMMAVILGARVTAARTALKHQWPRVLTIASTAALVAGVLVAGWATSGRSFADPATSSNILLVAFAMLLLLRLLPLVYYDPLLRGARRLVTLLCFIADACLAYLLNSVRFVLSLFDVLTGLQAQLLFNTAYARQVMADQQLGYSKLPELIGEALKAKRAAARARAQRQLRARRAIAWCAP